MKKKILGLSLLMSLALAFFFQNCGQGFKAAGSDFTSLSSQCMAQTKMEASSLQLNVEELNCGDVGHYTCERRIFRPDVPDKSEKIKECNGESCLDVQIHQFNSAVAREAGGDDAEFLEGGAYNREEVKCHHRILHRGISLFEGDGATLEESLAKAIAACRRVEVGS